MDEKEEYEENVNPEEQDSSPARNYDDEHYKGHHDRLLLGHQDECDMCRTVKRNSDRDSRDAESYRKRLEAAGVDPNDRDAVEHYRKHTEQEETDQMRMRRHRGEEEPQDRPAIGEHKDTEGNGKKIVPRNVNDHSDSPQLKPHNPFDKDTHGRVDKEHENPSHDQDNDGWGKH